MDNKNGAFKGGCAVLFFAGIAALLFLSSKGVTELHNRWRLGAILRPDKIAVEGPQSFEAARANGADCYCVTPVE